MALKSSLKNDLPLYEQIKNEILRSILTGERKPFERLPSIRSLARSLQVGVVTVKRAYDELVNEGYVISKEAVGYFVNNIDLSSQKKHFSLEIKKKFKKVVEEAKVYNLSDKKILEILKETLDE